MPEPPSGAIRRVHFVLPELPFSALARRHSVSNLEWNCASLYPCRKELVSADQGHACLTGSSSDLSRLATSSLLVAALESLGLGFCAQPAVNVTLVLFAEARERAALP